MKVSNYPNGFAYGINIRGIPLQVAHPGKVFWVNNSGVLAPGGVSGSDGNDGTYLKPFSTLDYAIGKCKASRGDIIMLMPGHIEAVTATSIAVDVAGIAIIGLGEGDLRPLFNFGATTSNIAVSAANCSLNNLVLKSTIDSVVAAITVSASGVTLDLETRDTSAAIEFVSAIVSTADADNLQLKLSHRGFVAGNAMTRYVDLVGCRDAKIDVDFFGIASTSVVDMRTTACDNVQVTGRFYNESAALTKNVTNNTTATWSVEGFDAKAAKSFSGSDDQAVRYTDADLITDDVNNPIGVDDADNAFASTNVAANRDGSVLERLEAIYAAQVDDVAGNLIGFDDADNVAATTNVVANRDGSILERLEHVLDCLVDDETTNALGVDDADNAFASTNVVANLNGSILERLEALMDPLSGYNPRMGFGVTKVSNLADGAGTDDLFTVTGRVLITSLTGEVTTVIGGAATLKIRDITNSVDLCAATTIDTDAVGTMYALTSISANILNGTGATPVVGSIPNITGASQVDVAVVGDVQAALTLSQVLDAADTGAITWRLTYIPLVASATVAAAA